MREVFAPLLIAFALAAGSPTASAGALPLLRPEFTADHRFVFKAREPSVALAEPGLGLELVAFARAIPGCHLNFAAARDRLNLILDPSSALWAMLDLVFPGSRARVVAKGVTISLDDFSSYAGLHPEYASYFVRTGDGPLIGLDCSSEIATSYWLPSLAHELTHALFEGSGVESWWEEGIAQTIEAAIGGEQPELTLKHLAGASELPALLETARPIPTQAGYAISYLFVTYLRSVQGGFPALRALADPGAASACAQEPDFISTLACRARAYVSASPAGASRGTGLLPPEKLTRAGLLRYFYAALTMKNSSEPFYRIPGWEGFHALADPAFPLRLAPGQAAVLSPLAPTPSGCEVYRIRADARGEFEIFPRSAGMPDPAPPADPAVQDYQLVLNLGF